MPASATICEVGIQSGSSAYFCAANQQSLFSPISVMLVHGAHVFSVRAAHGELFIAKSQ